MFLTNRSSSILKSQEENEKFYIEGIMNKSIVDLEGEMISSEAYPGAVNTIKEKAAINQHIPIFVEHRRKELSLPIGKVVDAWNDDDTLYFRAEIAGGILGTPIRELIKGNYLRGCSIGGDALQTKSVFNSKLNKEVKTITKMELRELSLTGLPVNEAAVFSIAKSLNKQEGEVKRLMKSLDSAIDSQKIIFDFEKAVDPENLDEQSLTRIKDSLMNLANLLKIDVGGTNSEENAENKQEENVTSEVEQGKTFAPNKEDTTMEDKQDNEEEKALVNTDSSSKLDELSRKIDELNQKIDGKKIEKNDDSENNEEVSNEEDFDDLDLDSEENEENEEDFNDDDSEEDEIEEDDDKKDFKAKKKMGKSYNLGGEKMEILKCRNSNCGCEFESANYDAKFCPACGDRVVSKSTLIEEDEDIVCEDCGSVFGKSYEFETHYCPKCGKSLNSFSVATASSPKGANTEYKQEKEMPKGQAETESVAVAQSPEGAKTKTEASEEKDTGDSVNDFKDGNYVDASKKEKTDKRDEDINDARPSGKTMLGSFDAEKVANYGKDRTSKSIDTDTRLEKIEKALEVLVTEKATRQSLVPSEVEVKIEKSQPSQEDLDKAFVSFLIKK